uniref:ABC transporter permease n=1 Tax=Ningiella ruwaisensis TaxID=2364274 RepID=UPI0010A05455|nr:ABC transporter permease [Ningiella ruwaisensis]
MLTSIAWHSLVSRKKTVILTFLSLWISIMVLLSVEHIRLQAKESFNRTISGVDLIVGAPSGQLNLLLYSVFRMGSPTNNIQFDSLTMLQNHALVEWAIPISLGDSHRGFRVMGTNESYFQHFKYGNKQALTFSQGEAFENMFDAVLGADVAEQLGYKLNDKIVIAHGIGHTSFTNHDQAPFVIKGILSRTGTPVDKTVHVSLNAIEAIHLPPNALQALLEQPESYNVKPESITAIMLGLKNKFATFTVQRELNNYQQDRLMAVLPGVAMAELWTLMGSVENLLRAIAALVLIASLFGLATMLLASMNERQKEIAVLRVLGAGPATILSLILLESFILVLLSLVAAVGGVSLILFGLQGWLAAEFGLFLTPHLLSIDTLLVSGLIVIVALIVSFYPGIEAYKSALHSQLNDG